MLITYMLKLTTSLRFLLRRVSTILTIPRVEITVTGVVANTREDAWPPCGTLTIWNTDLVDLVTTNPGGETKNRPNEKSFVGRKRQREEDTKHSQAKKPKHSASGSGKNKKKWEKAKKVGKKALKG